MITATPGSLSIFVGSTLTLTCTSSGSPPDTFIWMKSDIPIVQSTNITTIHYNSTIAIFSIDYTIDSVSSSDSGAYTCIVTNPIGSDNHTFTVNICKLSVYYEC